MSTDNIKAEDLSYRVLQCSDDLSKFDCSLGDSMGLNQFIHSEALDYQREKLGITYLFFYQREVVGFATLAMSGIEIKHAPALLSTILSSRVSVKDYPALLIGRLGTRNDFRRRNIGRKICLWCLDTAKELSEKIGCKLVIVMTMGEPVTFYRKVGFEVFPRYEKKEKKWMYLKIP